MIALVPNQARLVKAVSGALTEAGAAGVIISDIS